MRVENGLRGHRSLLRGAPNTLASDLRLYQARANAP